MSPGTSSSSRTRDPPSRASSPPPPPPPLLRPCHVADEPTAAAILQVLVNFSLLVYSSFIYALTRLFFGPLRAVEVEQLTERAWFAITETCLAMTIFREEIGAWFLVMFVALVTGKVWGWIGDGRVELLEQQPPANPRLFHLRLSVSLSISFFYDVYILRYAVNTVIQLARPNMMVMFLFEFAVLATCSWRTVARYALSITEQNIQTAQRRELLAQQREAIRRQRETIIEQRRVAEEAGEEVSTEPLPSEDDVDELDLEVPGWAAKGEYILWLDLITGKPSPSPTQRGYRLMDGRHPETRHLHRLLLHASYLLWATYPHHAGSLHDVPGLR